MYNWHRARKSLKHVFCIGGAPGSGKTTISARISSDFRLDRYDGDGHLFNHLESATADKCPVMYKCWERSEKEGSNTWILEGRTAQEFADFMRKLAVEDFEMAIEDLLGMSKNKQIIADLRTGHPEWVRHISGPERLIFFASTDAYQDIVWQRRTWHLESTKQCADPKLAEANWIEHGRLFNKCVIDECEKYNLPLLITGGNMSIDEVYSAVCDHFGLS